MADLHLKQGDVRSALLEARQEIAFCDRQLQVNPANANALQGLAMADFQLGRAHELLAEHATSAVRTSELGEARSWYQQSLDIWTKQQKAGNLIPRYAPRLDEANRALQNSNRLLAAVVPPR